MSVGGLEFSPLLVSNFQPSLSLACPSKVVMMKMTSMMIRSRWLDVDIVDGGDRAERVKCCYGLFSSFGSCRNLRVCRTQICYFAISASNDTGMASYAAQRWLFLFGAALVAAVDYQGCS